MDKEQEITGEISHTTELGAKGTIGGTTDGTAQAAISYDLTTPNGIGVSYSAGFWDVVYDLPPAQLISFGNVLNSMSKDSAAAVRVFMDENGNILIAGVDGSASLGGKAEVELTKIDLDKRTNQPIKLEGEASAKGGASFIQINPQGMSLKLNLSAEIKGTVDITKLFKELSEAKFDKKGIAKLNGKVGVTGTVYQAPNFSIDPATQNLLVHQNIGSVSYFYTLKPDLKGEYNTTPNSWEANVQIGHHEVSVSYEKTILSDPFSYICGTSQVSALNNLRTGLLYSSGVLVYKPNLRAAITPVYNPAKPKIESIQDKISKLK